MDNMKKCNNFVGIFAFIFVICIGLGITGIILTIKDNNKRDEWFTSLHEIDAVVQSIELSNVNDSTYHYAIEIKYTFNSDDYLEKVIYSSKENAFPYNVNDIYKIRVDDNNKISKLEDYEHSMLAGGLFLGALLLFISSSVGFAIDQKND